MKNLKIITLVLATLLSCSSQNDSEPDSIIGQWQWVSYISGNALGLSSSWEDVNNGHILEFTENLNYSSTTPPICSSNPSNNGTYSIYFINEKSYINIILPCVGFDTGTFELEYYFYFKNNKLFLSPTSDCPEGCVFKYKKIE